MDDQVPLWASWGDDLSWREVPGPAGWPGVVLETSRARQRKTVTRSGEVVIKRDELRERGLYLFAPELPSGPLSSMDALAGLRRVSLLVRPHDRRAGDDVGPRRTVLQLGGGGWPMGASAEAPEPLLGPATWMLSGELELAGGVRPVRCTIVVAGHELDAPPSTWLRIPVAELSRRRRELLGPG